MKRLAVNVAKNFKYYLYFWKFGFHLQIMYRFNSLMILLGTTSWVLIDILFYQVTVSKINVLGGWTLAELVVLSSVVNLLFMQSRIFYQDGFEQTVERINNGDFDLYLAKPVSSQLLSILLPPDFTKIVFAPTTVILFILAYNIDNQIYFSAGGIHIFLSIMMILLSFLINYSLYLIFTTFSFFAGRVEAVLDFYEGMVDFMKYPLEIYQGFLRVILGGILPVGLLASIPAMILLGKVERPFTLACNYFLLSLVFLVISQIFWRFGLKHYSSASS